MADDRVIPAEMGAKLLDAYREVKAERDRLRASAENLLRVGPSATWADIEGFIRTALGPNSERRDDGS